MATRQSPEDFFRSRLQTQESIPIVPSTPTLQTGSFALELDPNMMFILGLVAIVGLIGLFAYLASGDKKKCQ